MNTTAYQFVEANSSEHFLAATHLFKEYAAGLNFDLCFQNFDQELAEIQVQYGEPSGGLLLIRTNDQWVGCAGVRRFAAEIGELKRMYIQPAHRGGGLGNRLMKEAIEVARKLGYRRLRLDTVKTMTSAIHVYQKFGFREIEPYRFNPMKEVLYLEMDIPGPR